jgi:thiamine biosynthesis protein ThiS
MKIKVKMVAMDGPSGRNGDGSGERQIGVDSGSPLSAVLQALNIESAESFMVLVNGDAVPSGQWPAHGIDDGDEITIFPPIKGG